jgi:hypothetical protein
MLNLPDKIKIFLIIQILAIPVSSSISVVTPMNLNTELPKALSSSCMFNKKFALARVAYYELIFHIIFQTPTLRTAKVKPSTIAIVILVLLKAEIKGLRCWDGF